MNSRRIYKILKKEKPDYVYQRVLKFMSYYVAKFQKRLNYKHYIHIADLYSLSFSNKDIKNRIKQFFFKKTLKYNPDFIAQTKEQVRVLTQYEKTPILQIYNMHQAPLIDVQAAVKEKVETVKKHVVWVANIKPIKQLELFLKIAENLSKYDELHFDIIGNVQDVAYSTPLLEKINQLPNITHYTDKDNEFVNDYLQKHAFLVVNTSISEGFSNVFIQSWLRGVPVFSLNSNPDNLFDTYSYLGKHFNGSLEQLSSTITHILKDDEYGINAEKCYVTAKELFSTENNISKLKSTLFK